MPEEQRRHPQDDHDLYGLSVARSFIANAPSPNHANLRERRRRNPGSLPLLLRRRAAPTAVSRRARHQPEDHDGQVAGNTQQEERAGKAGAAAQGVDPLGEGDNHEERSVTPPLLEMFWHHPQVNDRRRQGEGRQPRAGSCPTTRSCGRLRSPSASLPPWSTGLPNARGRRTDGTDTGLIGPEHRQERVGQDYGDAIDVT